MDFGNNLMHFAGVGSGMKFYENGPGQASKGYVDWSIKRYALYRYVVFNERLEGIEIDGYISELLKSEINETISK